MFFNSILFNMRKIFLTFFFALVCCFFVKANPVEMASEFYVDDASIEISLLSGSEVQLSSDLLDPTSLGSFVGGLTKEAKEKVAPKGDDQIVAAILAFFLGGWAIHRVYLGSTPLMILWYFITCYGIFGIVPFIDFLMILIKGTDSYVDSDKYFSF